MDFNNIQRFMWVNYEGEPWCVTMFHGTTEVPTFKPGDQVLVVSKIIGNLYQQITTIIDVEDPEHQTFPYGLDMGHKYMRAWATPFQIQKLDY